MITRVVTTLTGGAVGLALALFAFKVSALFGANPEFPVIRGEPDLELRYAVYLLGVCPALVCLGGWAGFGAAYDRRRAAQRGAGAVAGTAAAFLLLRLVGRLLPAISTPFAANLGAIGFLVTWVALAWAGAVFAGRAGVRRTTTP